MDFQNVPMSHQGVTSIEQSFKLCMEAFRNGYTETRRLKEESRFAFPFSLKQIKAMLLVVWQVSWQNAHPAIAHAGI